MSDIDFDEVDLPPFGILILLVLVSIGLEIYGRLKSWFSRITP